MSIYPVSAEYEGNGEFSSPGIAFSDYSRMSTYSHKLERARRLETPEWALNENKLRALMINYIEDRAYQAAYANREGTEKERLARAVQKLSERNKLLTKTLGPLCKEYVTLKNATPHSDEDLRRLRKLEIAIEGTDSTIRTNAEITTRVAGVIYYYYRLGYSSVDTAAPLGMKPPAVRVMLGRLHDTWANMVGEKQVRSRKGIPKKKAIN